MPAMPGWRLQEYGYTPGFRNRAENCIPDWSMSEPHSNLRPVTSWACSVVFMNTTSAPTGTRVIVGANVQPSILTTVDVPSVATASSG